MTQATAPNAEETRFRCRVPELILRHDGDCALATSTKSREVVGSAGAFNSPRLLMLFGIGPADELTAFGI